jgi:hypothetical protein
MIRLSLGANTVALTLTEKTTISSAKYLFEFISVSTQQKYYCIAADTSLYTDRYNLFTITVQVGAPNALLGQLQLVLGDEYLYNIYEQASTTNLDPTGLTNVESGMMTYDKTMTAREEFESALTTRKAYEP